MWRSLFSGKIEIRSSHLKFPEQIIMAPIFLVVNIYTFKLKKFTITKMILINRLHWKTKEKTNGLKIYSKLK